VKTIPLLMSAVLLCLSTIALAHSDVGTPGDQGPDAQQASTQQASAQEAFARLKTLAGHWTGQAVMAHQPGMSIGAVQVSLRVTSGGYALMHEMVPAGRSDDPSHGEDDPITMLYIEGDRLILTHYCDTGQNRPRMAGKLSPDGKTVEFDFLDLSGGTTHGYMNHAVFTLIDAEHHSEDWTSMTPEGQPVQAHMDLVRVR
jgi:hypothetical protein